MTDKNIPELSVATSAGDADLLLLHQGSFDKQVEVGILKADLLKTTNNLNDVSNAATARNNLGVPASSVVMLKANNLSDVVDKAAARANLEIPDLPNALIIGNNLSDLASKPTARTNLGLGSLATQNPGTMLTNAGANTNVDIGSLSEDVAPSLATNYFPVFNSATETHKKIKLQNLGFLRSTNNLNDVANATTARSNLGLGSVATQAPGTGLANSGSNLILDINSLTENTDPALTSFMPIYSSSGTQKTRIDKIGRGGETIVSVIEGSGMSAASFSGLIDNSSGKWILRGEGVSVLSATTVLGIRYGIPEIVSDSNSYSYTSKWSAITADGLGAQLSFYGEWSANKIQFIYDGAWMAQSGGSVCTFELWISRPSDSSCQTNLFGEACFMTTAGTTVGQQKLFYCNFMGRSKFTTAVQTLSVFPTASTFSGKFILSKVKE